MTDHRTNDIMGLLESIPLEYHDKIRQLAKYYYAFGIEDTKKLLSSIISIPATEMSDYAIYKKCL